jgi:Putative Flp pilus-assembly TadE/G-like
MMCARFLKNTAGNVTIMLAASMFAILGVAGAAIDFIRADNYRTTLNAAADAAALGAIAFIQSNVSGTDASIKAKAKAEALLIWRSNLSEGERNLAKDPAVDVRKVNDEWAVSVDYHGKMATSFLAVVGLRDTAVAGKATASAAVGTRHWNFTFAIDTSSSMGIGATQADMDAMQADPNIGCMFACHYDASGNDTMGRARTAGYKLRLDVVDEAVDSTITTLEAKRSVTAKAALFGMTDKITELVPLTSALGNVKDHNIQIAFTNASLGNTNYRSAVGELTTKVGPSGDGSSASKAREVVFIITDGIHDAVVPEPNMVTFGSSDHQMGPMDPAFCAEMKSKGALVGVLYINYIVPSGFEGWVSDYQNKIEPNLEACASPGFFHDASNVTELETSLQDMLAKAFTSEVRLTQ